MANFFSNLFAKIFGKSPILIHRILILGLDGGVGKTTVLYRLKEGTTFNTIHTVGFNLETVERNYTRYELWDIGGGIKIREKWHMYFENVKAIIFVIDSTDKDGWNLVEFELDRLLNEEKLEHCPFLLLTNKQDLPGALSVDDLKTTLKLEQWKNRTLYKPIANALKVATPRTLLYLLDKDQNGRHYSEQLILIGAKPYDSENFDKGVFYLVVLEFIL